MHTLMYTAGVVSDGGGGWDGHTTRAFFLSLLFSLVVADTVKVLVITFITASLLPGVLSPRAKVLRLLLRSFANALESLS